MRDDFTKKVKDTLAQRAAYVCSKPGCGELTIGPNADPEKSTCTGVAAHISAASSGGKRYVENLTSTERGGVQNGIWLCQTCAKIIDTDEDCYPIEVLFSWRREHENAIARRQSREEPSTRRQGSDGIIEASARVVYSDQGVPLLLCDVKNLSIDTLQIRTVRLRVHEFVSHQPMGQSSVGAPGIAEINLDELRRYKKKIQLPVMRHIRKGESDFFAFAFSAKQREGLFCGWSLEMSLISNFGPIQLNRVRVDIPHHKETSALDLIDTMKDAMRETWREMRESDDLMERICARFVLVRDPFWWPGYSAYYGGRMSYYSGPRNFLRSS